MKIHSLIVIIAILFLQSQIASAKILDGDCYNGRGVYLFENGDLYIGNWNKGLKDGLGLYIWADRSGYYFGSWSANGMNGMGAYYSVKGELIDLGIYENGDLNLSFLTNKNQPKKGNLYGDCLSNSGIFRWDNGSLYDGQWKNGNREGFGIYIWADGGVYDGLFSQNQIDIHGTMVWPNGNIYIGDFEQGTKSGYGTLYNSKGIILYQGKWKYDQQVKLGED